ncbi:hypothetical protein FHW00_001764 [Ochrobactrum sp. P6BSIII]|uniref:hypothetical protein n=1 Tax=unclassified Ochrobactrum TaxID=239106 RepID=UPI0009939676|nr:hypothetical protein [Ochrobactrum sp. P6BSIII]
MAVEEAYIVQRKKITDCIGSHGEGHAEERQKYMVEYRRERRRLYPDKVKDHAEKIRTQNPRLYKLAADSSYLPRGLV